MSREIVYHVVEELPKIADVVTFQETIWGFKTVTPLPHFVASNHNGGIIIGAYNQSELVGFCYGFPGFKKGKNILVSHMMAVNPLYRNQGIGEQLKFKQKEWAKSYGYEKIEWTYDPLESRNGYLNLRKLGGYVQTYILSYYGDLKDEINQGLPADRFLVEWDITSDNKPVGTSDLSLSNEEMITLVDWQEDGHLISPVIREVSYDNEFYQIAVPANIHDIKKEGIDVAKRWRQVHREVFQKLFAKGYVVVDIKKGSDKTAANYYIAQKMMEDSDDKRDK